LIEVADGIASQILLGRRYCVATGFNEIAVRAVGCVKAFFRLLASGPRKVIWKMLAGGGLTATGLPITAQHLIFQ
jgi:hypothetical protein